MNRVVCIVGMAVMLGARFAAAQPEALGSDAEVRPWAQGVSEAEQAIARDIYTQGNAEFAEARFAQALAKYREAIRHWDHPAIRFNMAVCLINLGQPLEAREHLERSLAYEAAPLGNTSYAQGLTYRALLDGQLAHLEASCTEPGAVVTLDGKYLFTAPGRAQPHVLPGEHLLAAAKPGFRATQTSFTTIPGARVRYELRLVPELVIAQPRWRYWKYVLGAGVVGVGAGAIAYLAARSEFAGYDDAAARACQQPGQPVGCTAEQLHALPDLRARKDRAETEQTVAFTLFAVGGAAVLTGVIGMIVDQPRVRTEPRRVAVVPTAGGMAISLSGSY